MGLLLPNDKHWLPADWVAMGFFTDCLGLVGEVAPSLADDINFCVKAQLDTLDLRTIERPSALQLLALIKQVLATSRANGGQEFHLPALYPIYIEKLEQLQDLVGDLVLQLPETASGRPPVPSPS